VLPTPVSGTTAAP